MHSYDNIPDAGWFADVLFRRALKTLTIVIGM